MSTTEQRLKVLEDELAEIKKAFIIDDEGDRDYTGHRLAHKAWMRRMDTANKFTGTILEKVVLTALGGIAVYVLQAVVAYFNK